MQLASLPVPKLEAPTMLVDGRMISFGGFTNGLGATDQVHAYDPATDVWSSLADMPTPVTHYGLARDDRTLWIAGGFVGDHPGPVTDEVWSYDIDLDLWSPGPPLPEPRGSGGLFLLGTKLSYVGGVEADRDTDSDKHWTLDLANLAAGWVAAPPMLTARNHFATIAVGGTAYLIGGQFRHDSSPFDVDLVSAYDPVSGWTSLSSLPFPRSHFEPGTYVHDGKIVIAGGRANSLGLAGVDAITSYDPVADVWTEVGLLPSALLAPGVKQLGDELLVAGGGPTPFEPKTTTQACPVGTPLGHIYVNAGGPSLSLISSWCGDQGFLGGKVYTDPSVGDIQNTVDDVLYWTERTGSDGAQTEFAYGLPLDDGNYRVRLHFAEIFWTATGKRVFDVTLEGALVLDDYDIVADAGPATAVVKEFDLTVADGVLDMAFLASVDRPKLSAFEVIPLNTPPVWNDLGLGLDGAYGEPELHGSGSLVQGTDFTIELLGALESSPGFLVFGPTRIDLPLLGGTLVPSPDWFSAITTNVTGGFAFGTAWLAPPGTSVYIQSWVADPAGFVGFAASNAIFVQAP
ncbi:MAG: malectin domain-containing carbohydrate-binding protein [Planctomycetota bacterium]